MKITVPTKQVFKIDRGLKGDWGMSVIAVLRKRRVQG